MPNMRRMASISVVLMLACGVQASWYWPFGSGDVKSEDVPRISELMETASELIEEASDLAADGKTDESVEKYRKALLELDRVERENPERIRNGGLSSLKTKRAYVNAAIDSLLLGQIERNAKAVAVSDTTELEKKLAAERGEAEKAKVKGEGEGESAVRRDPRLRLDRRSRSRSASRRLPTSRPATMRRRSLSSARCWRRSRTARWRSISRRRWR